MADGLTISVDASSALTMLDRLGAEAEVLVRRAAKETAIRVRNEAQRRLKSQTHGTGQTAKNLVVEDRTAWSTHQGGVYAVFARAFRRSANLPLWLELGTLHMRPRPFLFSAAQLEEGPHMRRVTAALQEASDKVS